MKESSDLKRYFNYLVAQCQKCYQDEARLMELEECYDDTIEWVTMPGCREMGSKRKDDHLYYKAAKMLEVTAEMFQELSNQAEEELKAFLEIVRKEPKEVQIELLGMVLPEEGIPEEFWEKI